MYLLDFYNIFHEELNRLDNCKISCYET